MVLAHIVLDQINLLLISLLLSSYFTDFIFLFHWSDMDHVHSTVSLSLTRFASPSLWLGRSENILAKALTLTYEAHRL